MIVLLCFFFQAVFFSNLHPEVVEQQNKAKDHGIEGDVEVVVYCIRRHKLLATPLVPGLGLLKFNLKLRGCSLSCSLSMHSAKSTSRTSSGLGFRV